MKKCVLCGKENNDESLFCSGCGAHEFEKTQPAKLSAVPPAAPPQAPIPPQKVYVPKKPVPLSFFDVLSIFGMAASIIGIAAAGVILEPLALIASITAFFKTQYKGLAAAGIVVSAIAFAIKLLNLLYKSGIIQKWVVDGIFL